MLAVLGARKVFKEESVMVWSSNLPKHTKQSAFICEDSQINNILYHFMCFVLFFFEMFGLLSPTYQQKQESDAWREIHAYHCVSWALSAINWCKQGLSRATGPLKKAIGWGKVSINNMDFTDLPSGYLTVRHGKVHHF